MIIRELIMVIRMMSKNNCKLIEGDLMTAINNQNSRTSYEEKNRKNRLQYKNFIYLLSGMVVNLII